MLAAIHANDFQRLFAEDGIDTFVFRDGLIQVQGSATRRNATAEGHAGPPAPCNGIASRYMRSSNR
jgi:hypothetical protein